MIELELELEHLKRENAGLIRQQEQVVNRIEDSYDVRIPNTKKKICFVFNTLHMYTLYTPPGHSYSYYTHIYLFIFK